MKEITIHRNLGEHKWLGVGGSCRKYIPKPNSKFLLEKGLTLSITMQTFYPTFPKVQTVLTGHP